MSFTDVLEEPPETEAPIAPMNNEPEAIAPMDKPETIAPMDESAAIAAMNEAEAIAPIINQLDKELDAINYIKENFDKWDAAAESRQQSILDPTSQRQSEQDGIPDIGYDNSLKQLQSLRSSLMEDDRVDFRLCRTSEDVSPLDPSVKKKASKSLLDTGFSMRNVGSLQDALKDAGHEVLSHVSDDNSCPCSPSASAISVDSTQMLVRGFGIRNAESLEKALLDDEARRKVLEEKYGKASGSEFECESLKSWPSKCSSETSHVASMTSADQKSLHRRQLEYLMGLDVIPEESDGRKRELIFGLLGFGEGEDESITDDETASLAMRRAQRYLRTHKIFEFFQFLIAHLLSALPDNPIHFLLNLLDSCLMYRSGLGNPPLLFEIRHLVELFYLMDRMRTGFIEPEQYKTGMVTLGICSYNKNPPLSPDGMVAKETFIEETYECLCDLLSDMIRRRGPPLTPSKSTSLMTPPPSIANYGFTQRSLFDGE